LLLRATTIAFVGVAAWQFLLAPLLGHFSGRFEDFSAYIGAARNMAAGRSPYAAFNGDASVVMTGFDYPPFAAVLVRPLALLSDTAAMTFWLWLSLACTVAGALVVARTALPERWPRTEIGLIAAVAFAPATYNYWHGQMNPVILLLLALAFQSWVRGREVRCGALLGLAAAIKLSPLVLVVLLLRRRWWRGAAAMVGTAAASVLVAVPFIGVSGVRTFADTVLPALTRETGWIYNQSLGGLLSRLDDHAVLTLAPGSSLLHAAVLTTAAAAVLLAAWVVRPGARDSAGRGAEFGLGVVAMLLAGSIAWYPHFTHLLIPLAAAAGLVAARGWRAERRVATAALIVLVMFAAVAPLVIDSLTMQSFVDLQRTRAWWIVLQLFSLPCAAVVGLYGALWTSSASSTRPASTG
jgi:uncharacterized membrane protein